MAYPVLLMMSFGHFSVTLLSLMPLGVSVNVMLALGFPMLTTTVFGRDIVHSVGPGVAIGFAVMLSRNFFQRVQKIRQRAQWITMLPLFGAGVVYSVGRYYGWGVWNPTSLHHFALAWMCGVIVVVCTFAGLCWGENSEFIHRRKGVK